MHSFFLVKHCMYMVLNSQSNTFSKYPLSCERLSRRHLGIKKHQAQLYCLEEQRWVTATKPSYCNGHSGPQYTEHPFENCPTQLNLRRDQECRDNLSITRI